MAQAFVRYTANRDGTICRDGVVLKGSLDSKGYKTYALYLTPNKRTMKKGHRLVAESFIPNPDNLPQVNHINGIKTDNRVENLEWVSNQQNIDHAIRSGLIDTRGEKSGRNVHKEAKVREILQSSKSNTELSKLYKMSAAYISHIRAGRRWHWLWEQYHG